MKRNQILAVAMVVALNMAFAQTAKAPQPVETLLTLAKAKAKAEKKSVFVIFHASWCGWCKKMEAALDSKELKPVFDKHFVFVMVDTGESADKKNLENPGGQKLMADLGGDKAGFPFYAILDASGKKLVDSRLPAEGKEPSNIGHPAKPEEIAWFMAMLQKSAPRMTEAEQKTIKSYLEAQKL